MSQIPHTPTKLADLLRIAGVKMNTTLDFEKLLDEILKQIALVLPFDTASIMLLEKDTAQIVRLRVADTNKPWDWVQKNANALTFNIHDTHNLQTMMENGRSLIIPDVTEDPHWINFGKNSYIRAWMGAPMIIQGQTIGFIHLDKTEPGFYQPEHADILEAFAQQAAIAIQNSRLHTKNQQQIEKLTALAAIAHAGAKAATVDELLTRCTEIIAERLYPDSFGFVLVNGDGTMSAHHAFHNRTPVTHPDKLPIGTGIVGQVIETGRPRRIADVTREVQYEGIVAHTHSELCVPLIVDGEIIGAINAESFLVNAFTEEDEHFLTTLASQLATAIEKIKLIAAEKQRRQELETIASLSAALRDFDDLATMLPVILDNVLQLVQGSFGGIYLIEPDEQTMVVRCTVPHVPEIIGQQQSVQTGISGYVARTGRVYIAPDVTNDPLIYLAPEEKSLANGLEACINLPLRTKERVLGVLYVTLDHAHVFSDREIQLLTAVTEIAAAAIDRIMMLDSLEQRVQQRTQELAEANENLKELDRLKTKFVSDVSHELRTPATNLSLYLDLMERGRPERREQYTAVLRRQIGRLITMIEDILNLSRLDMDKIEWQIVSLDVNEVIRQVAANRQPETETTLSPTLELRKNIPPILGDRKQISLVVNNVLNNAVNYTPQGHIIVRTDWDEAANQIIIEVEDSGIGIPQDELAHIFDRFYRGSNVSQSAIAGTGLGLSIVKEVVALHHGHIAVSSAPGLGTLVRITFPTAPNFQ
jgi:signal transduction histidine kinase